jgi:hypothetical protein
MIPLKACPWHNVLDPEQIMALKFDAAESVMETIYSGRTTKCRQIVRWDRMKRTWKLSWKVFRRMILMKSLPLQLIPSEGETCWQYLLKLSGIRNCL